jgi:hypothetical protein
MSAIDDVDVTNIVAVSDEGAVFAGAEGRAPI